MHTLAYVLFAAFYTFNMEFHIFFYVLFLCKLLLLIKQQHEFEGILLLEGMKRRAQEADLLVALHLQGAFHFYPFQSPIRVGINTNSSYTNVSSRQSKCHTFVLQIALLKELLGTL